MRDLPPFLAPLVEDRPTAQLKLLAAWDGLSIESQIAVLHALRERDGKWEPAITPGLALKALASPNAYVRYLTATGLDRALIEHRKSPPDASGDCGGAESQDDSPKGLRERIEADPHPLVHYALLEREGWRGSEADELLRQPLDARLARLQGVHDAEKFAGIVRGAMSSGVVPESELAAMVKEWANHNLNLRSFTEEPWHPEGVIDISRDFKALWKLVPDVPEVAARILVAKLPATTATLLADPIPEEVLDRIRPPLLTQLFWRADVDLEDYRKKIALTEPLESGGGWLISAASHRAFDLTYDEFERLMQSDPNRLAKLAGTGMSPVLLQAAADFFSGKFKIKPPEHGSFGTVYIFEGTLDHRLRSSDEWGPRCYLRAQQLWALRVYALARNLANDADGFLASDSRKWLRKYVSRGDIWSTYLKLFDAAWGEVGEKLFGGRRTDESDPQVQKWEDVLPIPRSVKKARQQLRDRATGDVRVQRRLGRLDRKLDKRLGVVEQHLAIVERVAVGGRNLFLAMCVICVVALVLHSLFG